jgi:alpha/beta superfamily hydrolase
LRRAGWNVVTFHYRGSWGSQGEFSFTHCIEDVHAVLNYLRKSDITQKFRIDPKKIVPIGFSMGGFLSLITAFKDPSIKAAASIAGVNFGYWAKSGTNKEKGKIFLRLLEDSLLPLNGTTSKNLLEEVLSHENDWNFTNFVERLSNRFLLLVGGTKDIIVPISNHHNPLVESFYSGKATYIENKILEADHAFSDKRIALIKTILSWLEKLPQF